VTAPVARRPVPGPLVAGLLLVVIVLGVIGVELGKRAAPVMAPLPSYGELPSFTFTDQDGRPFDAERTRGRVLLVDFIFTRCPTVCPRLTQRMAALQEDLAPFHREVQLVSISVDPGYDTPEVLRAYGEKFGRRPELWQFVTGPSTEVVRVVEQGFKVGLDGARDGPVEVGEVVHSEQFVLVDELGHVRGFYPSTGDDLVKVTMDVKRLVKEARARR